MRGSAARRRAGAQRPAAARTLALDVHLAARLEQRLHVAQQVVRVGGELDAAREAGGLHARGRVDRVAKQACGGGPEDAGAAERGVCA
jgi:hypothetical protein